MIRLLFALSLFALLSSCQPDENTNQISDALNFLDQQVLDRASIKVDTIDVAVFRSVEALDSNFTAIKNLCETSKGYQSDTWEGLNDCSWAVEKARIDQSEYVNREGNRLQLKKASGTLELEHAQQDGQPTRYVQFRGYLPQSDYYIVELLQENQCTETKLIDRNSETEYLLKGRTLIQYPQENLFVFNQKIGDQASCLNKLAYYGWSDEGLTKFWELPLRDRKIDDIKIANKETLFLQLSHLERNKKQTTFLKISL